MGLAPARDLQSRRSNHGADTRPTGEHLSAGKLSPGTWFDLNSGSDDDAVGVRVVAVTPSHRSGRVRIEFITLRGDSGEAHLSPTLEVALMGDFDFEEEEW